MTGQHCTFTHLPKLTEPTWIPPELSKHVSKPAVNNLSALGASGEKVLELATSVAKDNEGPAVQATKSKEGAVEPEKQEEGTRDNITETRKYLPLPRKALRRKSMLGLAEHNTLQIQTHFVHPMTFNCPPGKDGHIRCDWCHDLIFGFLGLEPKTVTVTTPMSSGGLIEVAGGYTQEGLKVTEMCVQCTLERLLIVGCRKHKMEPIRGMDPNTFDFDSVPGWIQHGKVDQAPFQWCSICQQVAFFACVTSMEGLDSELVEGGCGLRLCEACTYGLSAEADADLSRWIAVKERKAGGLEPNTRLRADAHLLSKTGELMRQFTSK